MRSYSQIKLGALVSYFTVAFNMLAGLLYTPWMISRIGQENYGLYTLATSLITMFVMDFGMGAAVSRFVSKYNAVGDRQAVQNFLGLVYKLYLSIDAIIFAVLFVLYFFIDTIYQNLTADEIQTFKVLYMIVGLFSVISFPFSNLNGILTSYEKFVPLKMCDLFNKCVIIVAMVFALLAGYGVFALVTVNAVVGLVTICLKLFIIHHQTTARVNFRYFDESLLKEIFGFSVWTTVGSIMQRLVFNITPSIIAAVSSTGSVGVAVFGLASTIEGYIYTIATAINGMFMPRISRIVIGENKDEKLLELMVRVGRLQMMIVGLMVAGFVALGKSFVIEIWNKPDFSLSYYCAVLLILPSLFYLPMQIANTAIIVENKVRLQAIVFMAMGLVNVLCSLVLSHFYGALGASVSILIAYTVRNLLMAVIYQKVLHINMFKFAKATYLKFLPFILVTIALGVVCEAFNPVQNAYLRFGINGVVVVLVFCGLVWLFEMNDYEKQLVLSPVRKVLRRLIRTGKS